MESRVSSAASRAAARPTTEPPARCHAQCGHTSAARRPQTEVPAASPEARASVPVGRSASRAQPPLSVLPPQAEGRRQLHGYRHLHVTLPCPEPAIPAAPRSAAACAVNFHQLQRPTCTLGKQNESVTLEQNRRLVVVVVRTWCYTWVSVHPCARVHLIKKANTNVLASSAGQSSRKPYACSLREQVPGVPRCKITQPQGEEKDCEARPPHPPLLRRKGGAIFSIASALDAQGLGPVYHEN